MKRNVDTKKLVYLSLMAATALALGWLETLLPLPTPVPFIKLGLANVIVVTAMYVYSTADAFMIMLIKILASCFLFSGAAALPYSLAGGVLSFIVMAALRKTGLFGIIGVSSAGGAFHMLGQILVAAAIIENVNISFFMAPLLITGAVTGVFVGAASAALIERIDMLIKTRNGS